MSDIPVVPSLDLAPPEQAESIRSRPPHWRWYHIALTAAGIFSAQILALMAGLMVAASERGVSPEALPTMSDQQMLELSLQPLTVLVSVAVQEALMLAAVGLLGMLPRSASFRDMGYRPVTLQWVLIGGGAAIPLIFIRWSLATAVVEALDIDISSLENMSQMFTSGDTPQTIIPLVLLVSLVVPFVEELFFRGMVFKWLRDHVSLWPAAALSGLVFGIFHLHPVLALSTWILGVAAAWAYERSGSLWPAFAMHAVTNFVAQGLGYLLLWTGQQ